MLLAFTKLHLVDYWREILKHLHNPHLESSFMQKILISCTNISLPSENENQKLHSKDVFPNLHHHDQCNFFVGPLVIALMHYGAWNGVQHVSSTMKLGPTPLWSWWGGVNGCAWYHRHPTARPQLHLATKNKTAPLTINAAFWCGKCPDAIWKFLKNEGCMPSPFLTTKNFSPPKYSPSLPKINLWNRHSKKQPFLAGFCIPRWLKRG